MSDETTGSRRPAGDGGLFSTLLALIGAVVGFLESRISLFASESRVAVAQLVVLGTCLFLALLLFACGYFFSIVSVVVAIARVTQISWTWIALGAALMHFLLALICLLVARSKITKPLFRRTATELKKDAEWLKTLDTTTQPPN